MLLHFCSKPFNIYQRTTNCKLCLTSRYKVTTCKSRFYFSFDFFKEKYHREKIGNIRVLLIWLDYEFLSVYFSLLFFTGCHNDLNSFSWKKLVAERTSCHKEKKMNKSQLMISWEAPLFCFDNRYCTRTLLSCTIEF